MTPTVTPTLRPYPAYKPSGVPWLGDVPAHWEVRRLKSICVRSALYGANVAASSYAVTGVRFLRTTDISEEGLLKDQGVFLPKSEVRDYLLSDGDLLISRSGTIGRSFLYNSEVHGPCAYAGYLVRFVPASVVVPRFLFLYTKTQAFAGFLRVMSISSTIENVNGDKYANAYCPLPPLPEQRAIVRYLDHADRRIRRYVDAKERLIALLEEERQAVVARAVTRGLDPNARLKPSGVPWLGDMPTHWEVRRGKMLFQPIDVRSDTGSEELLTVSAARGVVPRKSANVTMFKAESYVGYKLCWPGDLVINSLWAWAHGLGVSQHLGIVSSAYGVYRPLTKVHARFIHLLVRSVPFQWELQVRSKGIWISRLQLTDEAFLGAPIPIPPLAEQRAIVEYVDRATARIDAATARARRQIELLEEYRARLIADVVTGKLDVRDAAAQLAEQAGDREPVGGSALGGSGTGGGAAEV